MTTRQSHKRRGFGFETDLVKWFRDEGLVAERLARTGAKDEGDVYFTHDGHWHVVEAKAPGRDGKIDLSGWSREATLEAAHFAAARGIPAEKVHAYVVIKARGKSLDQAYVVRALRDVVTDLQ